MTTHPELCPECGSLLSTAYTICPNCNARLGDQHQATASLEAQEFIDWAGEALKQRQPAKALRHINLALQFDPLSARAHNLRGLILEDSGQLRDAIAAYRTAAQLDPDFSDAQENLHSAIAEFGPKPHNQPNPGLYEDNPYLQVMRRKTLSGCLVLALIAVLILVVAIEQRQALFDRARQLLQAFAPSQTVTLVYEPNRDYLSAPVARSVLQSAAQIMSQRTAALKASGEFVVNDAGQISGEITSQLETGTLSNTVSAFGFVEIIEVRNRLLDEGQFVDTDQGNRYHTASTQNPWHTLLTNKDLELAQAKAYPNGSFIFAFNLSAEANQQLSRQVTAFPGTRLALVLDKQVIAITRFDLSRENPGLEFRGNTSISQQTQRIAALLQTPALSIPLRLVEIRRVLP